MSRHRLLRIYDKLYAAYGPQGWWPARTPFEVALGAILTQNTAWPQVVRAIRNLRKSRCVTHAGVLSIPEDKLAALIRPAGYYRVKAKRLKNFARFLEDAYRGDMWRLKKQDTARAREELLGVNGIGRETADSILLYACQKPVFVIDAYTRRALSRHGYETALREDYDVVARWFTEALPRDTALFNEYHALIVRLGKGHCKKAKPVCRSCPLEG